MLSHSWLVYSRRSHQWSNDVPPGVSATPASAIFVHTEIHHRLQEYELAADYDGATTSSGPAESLSSQGGGGSGSGESSSGGGFDGDDGDDEDVQRRSPSDVTEASSSDSSSAKIWQGRGRQPKTGPSHPDRANFGFAEFDDTIPHPDQVCTSPLLLFANRRSVNHASTASLLCAARRRRRRLPVRVSGDWLQQRSAAQQQQQQAPTGMRRGPLGTVEIGWRVRDGGSSGSSRINHAPAKNSPVRCVLLPATTHWRPPASPPHTQTDATNIISTSTSTDKICEPAPASVQLLCGFWFLSICLCCL